jgi:hypothetical protein
MVFRVPVELAYYLIFRVNKFTTAQVEVVDVGGLAVSVFLVSPVVVPVAMIMILMEQLVRQTLVLVAVVAVQVVLTVVPVVPAWS